MKLTPTQLAALRLAEAENLKQYTVVRGKSVTRYSERTGLGAAVSPRSVKALLDAGLVKVQAPPYPQGFRPTLVVLTDAGREYLAGRSES